MIIEYGLFSALFITQFIGHRIGDYLIQSNKHALTKASNKESLLIHCFMYATSIFLMSLLVVEVQWAVLIYVATIIEHVIVDTRKPVIWWKQFFERKIMRDKTFDVEALPFFVLIEIDQSIHLVRIFVISYVLSFLL